MSLELLLLLCVRGNMASESIEAERIIEGLARDDNKLTGLRLGLYPLPLLLLLLSTDDVDDCWYCGACAVDSDCRLFTTEDSSGKPLPEDGAGA